MNDTTIQQFRIYDPVAKCYFYSGETPMTLAGFFEQTATLHTVHGMPYERRTGIKDKSGEDIYQGDIIENDSDWYAVEWDEELATFMAIGYFGSENFPLWDAITGDGFIQGNVRENPDLLEETVDDANA